MPETNDQATNEYGVGETVFVEKPTYEGPLIAELHGIHAHLQSARACMTAEQFEFALKRAFDHVREASVALSELRGPINESEIIAVQGLLERFEDAEDEQQQARLALSFVRRFGLRVVDTWNHLNGMADGRGPDYWKTRL